MPTLSLLYATIASFVFLLLVFRPLEMAFPARPGQKFFRPAWWTDLCFFLGQYLIWNAVVSTAILGIVRGVGYISPDGLREGVASLQASVRLQPWWLQALEVVLISDFCVYWGHRVQHATPLLWRFHSIHHSAEHLDWLAAHREHPVDTIYTLTLINLPIFLLGYDASVLLGLIAFRGVWAIYIHSNARIPLGPLKMLIGAPQLHHWHHDRARDAGNYANISPLMDLLFGTYRCPDHEPAAFGISEPIPRSYLGQMLHPFLPRKRRMVAVESAPVVEANVKAA
jgi:sterol desaturase/sphingolipid hydroxylase (fatty acid hydroxylase superfamily)